MVQAERDFVDATSLFRSFFDCFASLAILAIALFDICLPQPAHSKFTIRKHAEVIARLDFL